jgi:hypothetical protein
MSRQSTTRERRARQARARHRRVGQPSGASRGSGRRGPSTPSGPTSPPPSSGHPDRGHPRSRQDPQRDAEPRGVRLQGPRERAPLDRRRPLRLGTPTRRPRRHHREPRLGRGWRRRDRAPRPPDRRPAYKRYFTKYLRNEKALWTPEESRAAALAVTGTTTTGGYAVPYVFDPTIIHIGVYTAQNPFRQACRVETITNGNNWRTVTVGAVTTAYITEAGAATEQGPTFGQPTYTVQSAHAFATVSTRRSRTAPTSAPS